MNIKQRNFINQVCSNCDATITAAELAKILAHLIDLGKTSSSKDEEKAVAQSVKMIESGYQDGRIAASLKQRAYFKRLIEFNPAATTGYIIAVAKEQIRNKANKNN